MSFPSPAVGSNSALAQAPPTASGSNVTLDDRSSLGDGFVAPGAPIPGSASVDRQAPATGPGARRELIGVASAELAIAAAASASLENSGLESEDEAMDEEQDHGAPEDIPLSTHIHSIAKALMPWLR